MTINSWKEEFLAIEANNPSLDTAVKRIEHSLWKWTGLRKENLDKHGVSKFGKVLKDAESYCLLVINSNSCSLCCFYMDFYKEFYMDYYKEDCSSCPAQKRLLGCAGGKSPWEIWIESDNPEPMIEALAKTLDEYIEKEGAK